jgi:Na+/proline symporter
MKLITLGDYFRQRLEKRAHCRVRHGHRRRAVFRLACAFVPLVAGLYWKRANNLGAGLAISRGLAV